MTKNIQASGIIFAREQPKPLYQHSLEIDGSDIWNHICHGTIQALSPTFSNPTFGIIFAREQSKAPSPTFSNSDIWNHICQGAIQAPSPTFSKNGRKHSSLWATTFGHKLLGLLYYGSIMSRIFALLLL